MRKRIALAAGAAVLLVAAFVAGRYSAPVKTITTNVLDERLVAQAVEAARSQWQREVTDHTVRRTIYKDGKPVERIVYVDREIHAGGSSESASSSNVATQSHSATTKTTETARPSWSLGLSGTWSGLPSSMPDRLGLELDRRIVGTVWLGLRASAEPDLSARQFGAALRLEW